MSAARCIDCGERFERKADEKWKVRCVPCWRLRKASTPAKPADDGGIGQHLRELLQLCHPDRHGGSELATRITAWLLSLRGQRTS